MNAPGKLTTQESNRLFPATAFQVVLAFSLFALTISFLPACGGSQKKKILSAEDQFALAKNQYDKGNFFESAEEFQKVVYNYPGSVLVDSAQFFLARSYLDDKQWELAAVEFERLIRNYPRSPFSVDSRYLIGYSYFRAAPRHYGLDQTDLKRAIELMEDFLIDFPESERIPEALSAIKEARGRLARKEYEAAIVYMRIDAWPSALIYFQRVIDLYGESDYTPLALLGIGEANYRLLNLETAEEKLTAFLSLYPEHKSANSASKLLEKTREALAAKVPVKQEPLDSLQNAILPLSE